MHDVWEIPDKKGLTDAEYVAKQRDRAAHLTAQTARVEEDQYAWHQLILYNSTLYNNRAVSSFLWGSETRDQTNFWPVNLRTENFIKNVGATMLAKAASSPLRPTLVPHGASWKTYRAVKTGDRFIWGLWQQSNSETAALEMFNDAYTAGIGAVQVHATKDKVFTEAVFYDNIIVDERECPNRAEPRTVRIRKVVPLQDVIHKFKTDACGNPLKKEDKRYVTHRHMGLDWVPLIEVWRLPDAEGNGGYHGIVCDNQILFEEVWDECWYPVVFFHWEDRVSDFHVSSGVEQVIPYQIRQNELNDTIEENQRISCAAGLLAPASTQFDWSQWYSDAGRIALYHGLEPKPLQIPTNLAELYQERIRNKEALYAHMALNEMFSQGQFQQSVRFDSSAGLREARNMEDARHLRLWVAFEKARLAIARTLLRMVRRLDKANFSVLYRPFGSSFAGTEVQWKDVAQLTEQEYEWEMSPASINQMSPAARRETLAQRLSRGQMNAGQGQDSQMVTHPDLEMLERFELANEEDITRHLELLEEGKYEKPTIWTDAVKGQLMVLANMHRLNRYSDVPARVLANHERWLVEIAALQKQKMMQQAAANQPPPQQQLTPYQPTQGLPGTSASVGNFGGPPMMPPQ